MKRYRYYSTQRPVSLGTYPRRENVVEIHNYDQRTLLDNGIRAWGYIDYNLPLTPAEMSDYELVEPRVTRDEFINGLTLFVDFHSIEAAIRADFPYLPTDTVEYAALYYFRAVERADRGGVPGGPAEYLQSRAGVLYNILARQ